MPCCWPSSSRQSRAVEQAPCLHTQTWEIFAELGFLRSGQVPRSPNGRSLLVEARLRIYGVLEPIRSAVHPLRQRCRNIVRDTPLDVIAENDDAWLEFLLETESQFSAASKEWQEDYEALRGAWTDIPKDPSSAALPGERAKANSIRYQLGALSDISVIEWFSDAGFLPRYGFPIHLQRLSVRTTASRSGGQIHNPPKRHRLRARHRS